MKKKMKAVKKNSQVVTEFEYKSDGLNLSGSISQTHEGEFVRRMIHRKAGKWGILILPPEVAE